MSETIPGVAASDGGGGSGSDAAPETRSSSLAGHYLSSLAVEDLREYDALLLATVLLLVGLVLSARCSRVLTRLREARDAKRLAQRGGAGSVVAVGGDSKSPNTRRRKKGSGKVHELSSGDEMDDLAAEEQAFLDDV